MKPIHKGLLVSVLLAAAGVTVWSAAAATRTDTPEAPPAQETPAPGSAQPASPRELELENAGEPVPVANSAVDERARVKDLLARAGRESDGPDDGDAEPAMVPSDLVVSVSESPAGKTLKVQRSGHLLAVVGAGERRVALHEITLAVGSASASELTWETTSPRSLETLRGKLSVGADGKVAVTSVVAPASRVTDTRHSHNCVGHGDGAGGFVVVCTVDAPAAGTSLDGDKPQDGVWSLAGERTLLRFDLPMTGDGASARVLGYEKGGQGVIVRIEASRVPGEEEAVLAIGADSRPQPEPIRPRCCFCRIPRGDIIDF
ncbi:MAG: hypothetical protein R3B70_25045 [Polyangiaceae bacterium]